MWLSCSTKLSMLNCSAIQLSFVIKFNTCKNGTFLVIYILVFIVDHCVRFLFSGCKYQIQPPESWPYSSYGPWRCCTSGEKIKIKYNFTTNFDSQKIVTVKYWNSLKETLMCVSGCMKIKKNMKSAKEFPLLVISFCSTEVHSHMD